MLSQHRQRIEDPHGRSLDLVYCLISDQVLLENRMVETYGIGIFCDDGKELYWEMVPDISPCPEEVKELISKLCEGHVTPLTLRDIIFDHIEK